MTGVRRRRKLDAAAQQQQQDEASGVSLGERELDRETAYLERADLPVRQHELNSKAFNMLWLDLFKTFSLLVSAASIWMALRSFVEAGFSVNEDLVFALATLLCFVQARRWLAQVNVSQRVCEEESISPLVFWYQRYFLHFALAVALQSAFPLLLHVFMGWPLAKCLAKYFPTGLVFLIVTSLAIAYMRSSVSTTERFRKDLPNVLFGSDGS